MLIISGPQAADLPYDWSGWNFAGPLSDGKPKKQTFING